jgi:rRNA maturation endonuclease Nob1
MPIKCETCGAEYEESPGKFCANCGRTLSRFHLEMETEEEEKKVCLKCGHRNPMEKRFCDNCGELLHAPRLG